jgi:hypothetical protein
MDEIRKLLRAQQCIAEVVASGKPIPFDVLQLRDVLRMIPGIIKRIENKA